MNIREVAKKAGVSTATVSRVVNGTVPVSALIERQVRTAIKSLGYYPNTHARTLGSGRSHMYGLIISDIANPFFPDIVKFFERIAIEHLISVGHKRIAFVSGPPTLASAKTRSNAFALSIKRKGLRFRADYIQIGNHRIDGGQSAMAKLLKLRQPPTAVMASNDLTAIGMMREIRAAGLHVPGDISVLGFDDIEISNFLQPPLTTIRVPRAELGVSAFNALYAANHRRGDHR